MRNIIIISLAVLLCSCKFEIKHNTISTQSNESVTKGSYYLNSKFHQDFNIKNDIDKTKIEIMCKFSSSHIQSKTLDLEILLKHGNKSHKDIINTKTCSKLIDISKSDSIEIDSVNYALIDDAFTLNFIVISRNSQNKSNETVTRQLISYQTNINTPKAKIYLLKTELCTIEKKSTLEVPESTKVNSTYITLTTNNKFSKTYKIEKILSGKKTNLDCKFSFSKEDPKSPNLDITVDQNNINFSETIRSQHFAKFIQLQNAQTMEIDSINFDLNNTNIKVRFDIITKYGNSKNTQSSNISSIMYESDLQKKVKKITLIKKREYTTTINNTFTYNSK